MYHDDMKAEQGAGPSRPPGRVKLQSV
jgi:hypothetical protein